MNDVVILIKYNIRTEASQFALECKQVVGEGEIGDFVSNLRKNWAHTRDNLG